MSVRGVVYSALFAALFLVLSFVRVPLPGTPVPVVLENFVAMLAGAVLGPVYGFLSMFLVVVLTALGVPMLGGSGGIGVLLSYTGGYVIAWPFSALLIGLLLRKVRGRSTWTFIRTAVVVVVFGMLLPYVTGVPWFAHVAKVSLGKAMTLACYPYLPGDLLKAVLVTIIAVPVRAVYPVDRWLKQGGSAVVKGEA